MWIIVAALVASAVALLNDAAGAWLAKAGEFPLSRLALPTLLVFVLIGFFLRVALLDARVATAVAALAAVVSATAGFMLVRRIGPPRTQASASRLFAGLVLSVVVETGAALCGATWLVYAVGSALVHRG